MKTTELFAEQVLIGLVVILIAVLAICGYKTPLDVLNNKTSLELIVASGFAIVGAAYLIGMVYDRVSDTLLQHAESHGRLHFVIKGLERDMKEAGRNEFILPKQDPFEDGRYRIIVLGNGQATDHMAYLRSRIRLTRSVATLLPALTVSILLAMDYGKASRWWWWVAIALPLIYLLTLLFKMKKCMTRPPKTYEIDELNQYVKVHCDLLGNPAKPRKLYFLWRDEIWIGIGLIAVAGTILILDSRSYERFSVLLSGLVLTGLVGWSWWRISITFYAFLRDYEQYGGCPPGCQPPKQTEDASPPKAVSKS